MDGWMALASKDWSSQSITDSENAAMEWNSVQMVMKQDRTYWLLLLSLSYNLRRNLPSSFTHSRTCVLSTLTASWGMRSSRQDRCGDWQGVSWQSSVQFSSLGCILRADFTCTSTSSCQSSLLSSCGAPVTHRQFSHFPAIQAVKTSSARADTQTKGSLEKAVHFQWRERERENHSFISNYYNRIKKKGKEER